MNEEITKSDNWMPDISIDNKGNWNQNGDNVAGDKIVNNNYYESKDTSFSGEDETITLSTVYNLEEQTNRIKKASVFPWLTGALRYFEAYPGLFVPPLLNNEKGKIKFDDLQKFVNDNIAITGVAGAGKSTLLKYFFAFCEHKDYDCVYLSVDEIKAAEDKFEKLINFPYSKNPKKLLVCIDGIDEAFNNDLGSYINFIAKINTSHNCSFWLGCRTDFYMQYLGERTSFSESNFALVPWDKKQSDYFINTYSEIVKKPDLPLKVEALLGAESHIMQIKSNPFHVALLIFLAEKAETIPLKGVYDLYERFIYEWFRHEGVHGSNRDNNEIILCTLRQAARNIYDGGAFVFDDVANNNTAISELLISDHKDILGNRTAHQFYHQSIAAFILAHNAVEAMLSGDIEQLKGAFAYKLKKDVTRFIGDKFSTLINSEKQSIKDNLEKLYQKEQESGNLSVTEQALYYITRLGIDVSDFLDEIIKNEPQNAIIRLTLAYGCALSDSCSLRQYALNYAKSIYEESEDAETIRGWAVIYYGDKPMGVDTMVSLDPYNYKDSEKGDWRNARKARIDRLTQKNPRLKDYRFRLFGIPSLYSFFKSRDWNELSPEELTIFETVEFPEEIFNEDEISFLEKVKGELVTEYKKHLETKEQV